MKSVYTGDEKVAEFESYDELRVGANKPAFVYEGAELVYPNPVKDGLVLWYDFSGRTNSDGQRGIAEDLSRNGNHGTLQNFNYTVESGYDKNKLLFDGVDDYIESKKNEISARSIEFSVVVGGKNETYGVIASTYLGGGFGGFGIYNYGTYLRIQASTSESGELFTVRGLTVGEKIHGAVVIDGTHCIIYVNGTKVLKSDFTNYLSGQSHPTNQGAWVGAYMGGTGYRSQEEFYSVKIYNRPLTPEEIAHNYAIEKERFGIE